MLLLLLFLNNFDVVVVFVVVFNDNFCIICQKGNKHWNQICFFLYFLCCFFFLYTVCLFFFFFNWVKRKTHKINSKKRGNNIFFKVQKNRNKLVFCLIDSKKKNKFKLLLRFWRHTKDKTLHNWKIKKNSLIFYFSFNFSFNLFNTNSIFQLFFGFRSANFCGFDFSNN